MLIFHLIIWCVHPLLWQIYIYTHILITFCINLQIKAFYICEYMTNNSIIKNMSVSRSVLKLRKIIMN